MGKAEVKSLVENLSEEQISDEAFERNWRLAVLDLVSKGLRTRAEVFEVSPDQVTFTLPETLGEPLAFFFDARMLAMESPSRLRSAVGMGWRDEKGSPLAIVKEEESAKTYRLFPTPQTTTKHQIIPLWSQLGSGYSIDGLTVIANEVRELPPSNLLWLDLWLALKVVERAFDEDSTIQDIEMAVTAGELATALELVLSI